MARASCWTVACSRDDGARPTSATSNHPFDPGQIDAVILSHAHIDHSGNLPHLVKAHFNGPIFATKATVDLADIMLRDSGHIQEADALFVNKKRAAARGSAHRALYTIEDAEQVAGHFCSMEYDQSFEAAPGVTARFVEAGHILGSAAVVARDPREWTQIAPVVFRGYWPAQAAPVARPGAPGCGRLHDHGIDLWG
jgi:metallo-beta-lactamase family protein